MLENDKPAAFPLLRRSKEEEDPIHTRISSMLAHTFFFLRCIHGSHLMGTETGGLSEFSLSVVFHEVFLAVRPRFL